MPKRGPYKKAQEIITEELCKFGCGNIAKFKAGNGSLMCSQTASACEANKKKNSDGLIRKHDEIFRLTGKAGLYNYDSLPVETKNNMAWARGKTADTDGRVKQMHQKRHQNFIDGKWIAIPQGVAVVSSLRWKRNYIPYVDSFGTEFKLESIHEWEVANILDKNKVLWSRPDKIKISSGVGYEPDFYLLDYDIYLDPKTRWKGTTSATSQGFPHQDKQLEKIKQCEVEHNIKCLILWSEDKRSHTWEGILEQITKYSLVNKPVVLVEEV